MGQAQRLGTGGAVAAQFSPRRISHTHVKALYKTAHTRVLEHMCADAPAKRTMTQCPSQRWYLIAAGYDTPVACSSALPRLTG